MKSEKLVDSFPWDMGKSIISSLRASNGDSMTGPHHGTVMFRKSSYNAVGGYRPQFYFAQDLDLWSRLIETGRLGWVHQGLYQVRFTADSISAKNREEQHKLKKIIEACTRLRRKGDSEDALLKNAEKIRPPHLSSGNKSSWEAEYFIASCLHRRKDPIAMSYFWNVVRKKPVSIKAWYKLLSSIRFT